MHAKEVMRRADVAALWDSFAYNAGFIVVKPTNISIRLYRMIKNMTSKSAGTDDQQALNRAINILRQQKSGVNTTVLNKQRFLSGKEYFEAGPQRRWFAPNGGEKCDRKKVENCAVVVHNNWIVSKASKVYRFREHVMWMHDGVDQYYTSSSRLYLTYTNQLPTLSHDDGLSKNEQQAITESEISALKTAMTIGHLLNRTVILPRFHSGSKAIESPLNSVLHVKSFDSDFAGQYRENSFLGHPKVPPDVNSGLSEQQLSWHIDKRSNSTTNRRNTTTVSDTDIIRQFGDVKDRVLRLESLHGVNIVLGNSNENDVFTKKLRRAFYHSDYRQYKRW